MLELETLVAETALRLSEFTYSNALGMIMCVEMGWGETSQS